MLRHDIDLLQQVMTRLGLDDQPTGSAIYDGYDQDEPGKIGVLAHDGAPLVWCDDFAEALRELIEIRESLDDEADAERQEEEADEELDAAVELAVQRERDAWWRALRPD